jgi:hypothetical protein
MAQWSGYGQASLQCKLLLFAVNSVISQKFRACGGQSAKGQLEYPFFQNAPPRRSATSGTYPLLSTDFVILSRLEQPLFPAPAVAEHIHYYRCTPRSGGRRAKRHGASAPASPPRHPPAPRVRPDVVHIRRSHRHRRPHRLCTQVRSMYHDHVALEADGSPSRTTNIQPQRRLLQAVPGRRTCGR